MSDSITINVSGLSGRVTLELPSESTVGDAREAAEVSDGMQVRYGGRAVSDDTPLEDGATLVTAPPAAKHGLIAA